MFWDNRIAEPALFDADASYPWAVEPVSLQAHGQSPYEPGRQFSGLPRHRLIDDQVIEILLQAERTRLDGPSDLRPLQEMIAALCPLGQRFERSVRSISADRAQLGTELMALRDRVRELTLVLRALRTLDPQVLNAASRRDGQLPGCPDGRLQPRGLDTEMLNRPRRLDCILARLANAPHVRYLGKVAASMAVTAVLGAASAVTSTRVATEAGDSSTENSEPVRTIIIQPGDTLTALAQRHYGSADRVREIAEANHLSNPDRIMAGASLILPALPEPPQSSAEDTVTVVVRPGDTLWHISGRVYGDESLFPAIASANGIANPHRILPGTTLSIPPRPSEPLPAPPMTTPTVPQPLNFNTSGPQQTPSTLSIPSRKFVWPTHGLTPPGGEFGAPRPSRGYSSHTGLDLAAPQGTPVVAAAAGTVVHAGPEGTYGYTVVIDHGNGYQTRYAHLLSWSVGRGQAVTQGQLVGLVGSTGYATGPHLHFEVLQTGRFINPRAVLP